ncbi:unnamed protein product [Musa banksii]
MGLVRSLLLLLALSAVASAAPFHSLLRAVPEDPTPGRSTDGEGVADRLFCDSWRLSVETNDAGYWRTIPQKCLKFVEDYVNGDRYASDFDVISSESLSFAETVPIAGDGKDVWIFDIDETLLSNVPYYAINGYGTFVFANNLMAPKLLGTNAPYLWMRSSFNSRKSTASTNANKFEVKKIKTMMICCYALGLGILHKRHWPTRLHMTAASQLCNISAGNVRIVDERLISNVCSGLQIMYAEVWYLNFSTMNYISCNCNMQIICFLIYIQYLKSLFIFHF